VLAQSEFDHLDNNLKKRLALYLGMIRNIDWNMGKLMKFLEDENLAEDTILIFKTDNGSLLGPQYFNAGMRGKKTEIWEGGHRVPCFIRWPNGRSWESPRCWGANSGSGYIAYCIRFMRNQT
jgi:arylsulfatase A-like enzyme